MVSIRYFWWEIIFTKSLFGAALEKLRTKDLPILNVVMDKISEQNEEFNPTFYYDSEAYIEKLLKMGKQLRRKKSI